MPAQTKGILCLLPPDINTTLSEGFLFQVAWLFLWQALWMEYHSSGGVCQWLLELSHLTRSRVANEELASFLKRFWGGIVADWEPCLHSELSFPLWFKFVFLVSSVSLQCLCIVQKVLRESSVLGSCWPIFTGSWWWKHVMVSHTACGVMPFLALGELGA